MSVCTVNARIPGSQKDTRISVKFPESRLSNSISEPWFYNSVVLVLMSNSIAHGSLLMHTDILYLTMIFKTFNSSCHVCVCVCVCSLYHKPSEFYTLRDVDKVVSGQDHLIAYRVYHKRFVHMVNAAQVSLTMPEPRLSIRVTDHWFDKFDISAISFHMWNSNVLMYYGIFTNS